MTILNEIGFISLTSLLILLIIYLIKPNYQQKFISSTFVWKLSLKYKKKKLPISKLRNILLIICQVLLLVSLTFIIVKPMTFTKKFVDNEAILIVDASASMRTTYEGESRFNKALELAKTKANEVLNSEGAVSVVISGNDPYFLIERGTVNSKTLIEDKINELENNALACSYGETDLIDSITLCHDVLLDNPNASIYIYTDTNILYVDESIHVINVSREEEYNFGILDAYTEIVENYYSFVVEVAGYGRNESVDVTLSVYGANITDIDPDGKTFDFTINVDLENDVAKRVVFINEDTESLFEDDNTVYYPIPDEEKIFSYDSAHIELGSTDCFYEDDYFDIYGGTKENIKVLYASNKANSFFNGVLYVLRDALKDKYHIDFTEIKDGDVPYEGYDLYIYEHEMVPEITPVDGIVVYANPEANTEKTGFKVYGYEDLEGISIPLLEVEDHPIFKGMSVGNITASRFTRLSELANNYEVLATINNTPAIIAKNEENNKVIAILFSLHYSNFALLKEFPIFMNNIFEYFIPPTFEGNAFEVNDEVEIKSRGTEVLITGYEKTQTINEFPNTVSLDLPGTYEISQTTYFGKDLSEKIFAKIPKSESNSFPEIDSISNPIATVSEYDYVSDWLLYLCMALTTFIFFEWILKENEAV